MNALVFLLLFQSSLPPLPPRAALEDPAVVSSVPKKLQKDYAKMWSRFVAGKEDAKLQKDLDKFLQKQKGFDPALTIQGYLALYRGDDSAAQDKFGQAVIANSNNRIALYYLAELAYAHNEFARAANLYGQLMAIDSSHPELETKRQKAFLLATENILRAAAVAESENRLAEAEGLVRQALQLAPGDPSLERQLANLLIKQNRKEEAAAIAKADVAPPPSRRVPDARASADQAKPDSLEDLGRWGAEIGLFRRIRSADRISREQFAILLLRYFPQLTELRQTPEILTDIQGSSAQSEILAITGIGVMDSLPNHEFAPAEPLSRGDLALSLSRVYRLLAIEGPAAASLSAPDVVSSNALYAPIGLVVGKGILGLEESGNFNVNGRVSGQQAVSALDRLLRLYERR